MCVLDYIKNFYNYNNITADYIFYNCKNQVKVKQYSEIYLQSILDNVLYLCELVLKINTLNK